MPTPKYNFTASNGQLLVTLDNSVPDFTNSEVLEYRAASVDFSNPISPQETRKIILYNFGEYKKDFIFENFKTIGGAVPTNISNAYDLLRALIPSPAQSSSGTVDTAFNEVAYTPTISHAFDSDNPNIFINLTGDLDLTYTGTTNKDSGLVNLYFSGTETATINGLKSLSLTGNGEMIPIYFVHDDTGIRWYDGRDSDGGSQDLQQTLEIGGNAVLTNEVNSQIVNINFTNDGINPPHLELYGQGAEVNSVVAIDNGILELTTQNASDGLKTTTIRVENPTNLTTINFPAPPVDGTFTLATTEDISNLEDGTILYHLATATTAGTVTSSGTSWTGTSTAITDNMVGAKITIDGQTTIIATVNSGAQTFTTVDAIPATSETFEVRCMAYKVFADGSISFYDYLGNRAYNMETNRNISINGIGLRPNGNVVVDGSQFDIQGQVLLLSNGGVYSAFRVDRIIHLFSTLPTFGSGDRVYASISDGGTPVYMTAASGGGSNNCSVYWNGALWLYK